MARVVELHSLDGRLERIADRMAQLLGEEPDLDEARSEVLHRMEAAGVYDGPMDLTGSPSQFATKVIEFNPHLRAAVSRLHDFNPYRIETLGELVSLLLPSQGELE